MSAGATSYPFPAEIAAIPRDRSAVIEASAGTGKTYLIEHLVVDRVLRGDARLDDMLIVTFTDPATAELARRLRALFAAVLAARAPAGAAPAATPSSSSWIIDAPARARLAAALRAIDAAPISTIHAFCQRVLTEHAFAGGRLLAQQNVESRTAFNAAFADVVRRRFARDPALAPYLAAWLASGRRVHGPRGLEELLYRAHQLRSAWAGHFDPAGLRRAAEDFAALPADEAEAAVRAAVTNAQSRAALLARLDALRAHVTALRAGGDALRFLAAVDAEVKRSDLFSFVEKRIAGPTATAALWARVAAVAEAALPLDTAVAQRLGPVVAERLRARKSAAGLYDFDDMLLLVRDALAGPGGPALAAALRRRYRLAIVDEFQDTDPVQWEILRAVFQPPDGGSPLYVVGDPKQAIYGFRGADVATYAAACADLAPAAVEPVRLGRSFRSTAAVVDATNAIFDQRAEPPFFTAGARYDNPIVSAAAAPRAAAPPITLLRVTADDDVARLPMRAVRAALTRAIADEIAALLAPPAALLAREIFVVTRTRRDSAEVVAALAARDVPHVVYSQEGLFETAEARHVRDLLRAIADPRDRERCARAWLTPFFGLTLGDLPAALAAADGPLRDRLLEWHDAAAREPLAHVLPRVLDGSGVVRRELFLGDGARRLTVYRQLFDALAAEAARTPQPIGDVARRLSALVAKLAVPAPEEGNVVELDSERDAVRVMTMHKAKGLEAEVVFVYGAFSAVGGNAVHSYTVDGRRVGLAGRPRREAVTDLIKRDRAGEDQRLLYVALTRARSRLYLPFSGGVKELDAAIDSAEAEELWKLTGGYRHVNARLRALTGGDDRAARFATRDVPVSAGGDGAPGGAAAARLAGWRPDEAALAPPAADPALARLASRRKGAITTSYSRLKHADASERAPSEIPDEVELPDAAADDELPGGARAGIFVHDVLETTPLDTVRDTPVAADWAARPDVRALIEAALRRHGRDPAELATVARLAHAALTAPLPVVGGALPGLGGAAAVARELEFLFPLPAAAGGADAGFVRGFIDVVFEHDGRGYFVDWKTDRLPAFDAATVDAHVEVNYTLQERLYTLALVELLGVTDEASHEARFGGALYVFVRGLPGGIRSRRPRFADIARWRRELGAQLGPGDDA